VGQADSLVATIAAAAGASEPDTAVRVANEIRRGRNGMLTGVQTTHATDQAIAGLVAAMPARSRRW
jgi:hypothetical protein